MPSINNVGGSLTSAIILTLLAWGVRVLRATAQRQGNNNQRRGSKSDLQASLGRFFAPLSPAALRMLVRKHCAAVQFPAMSPSCSTAWVTLLCISLRKGCGVCSCFLSTTVSGGGSLSLIFAQQIPASNPIMSDTCRCLRLVLPLELTRSQVEADPVPHLVVDVRSAEAAQDAPLPPELSGAVHIPEDEVPLRRTYAPTFPAQSSTGRCDACNMRIRS